MNVDQTPDYWVVIKFHYGYRLLCEYNGSYLEGKSWRASSGIKGVSVFNNYYLFYNTSGSIYKCYKNFYGLGSLSSNIYSSLKEKDDSIMLLDKETNWQKLNYNFYNE